MTQVSLRRGVTAVAVFLLVAGSAGGVVGAVSGPVDGGVPAAQSGLVSVDTNTSYDGLEEGNQAVSAEVTVTANEEITGLRMAVRQVDTAFVDYQSFTIEVSNVQYDNPSPGVYVANLSQGQSFTVNFEAYPRRLDKQQLQVASVRLTAQNPQTLERTAGVTADLSNSPYLAYQELQFLGDFGLAGVIAAIVLGVFGIAFGAYMWFFALKRTVSEKEDEFVDTLRSLRRDMNYAEDKDTVTEEIEERTGGDWDDGGF